MGFLSNTWINYVNRSYQQIMTWLLTKLGDKVPEITDHTANNPYIRELSIFAGLNEQLGYYIDNAARETKLDSARLYGSHIAKAREYDYRVIANVPYSVDVQFTVDAVVSSDYIIPANTVLSNSDGSISYRTKTNATITVGNTVSDLVTAYQVTPVTNVDVMDSSGIPNMEIPFTEKIAHDSMVVRWNGVLWDSKDSLAYSSPTDTHYVQSVNEAGNVTLRFGNEAPSGKIPVTGESLVVDYNLTLGAQGYLDAGSLNTIVSTLILPSGVTSITVVNPYQATGGSDVESISDLKRHIPVSNRTRNRAVTKTDYEEVAANAPGVAAAGVIYECYKDVTIYIVPNGGGIASSGLIASTLAFVDYRKMITTNITVYSAGEVHVLLLVDVFAKPNYANSDVTEAVNTALTDFLSFMEQGIKGKINLSDLYQRIENVAGVDYSTINSLSIVPYARPTNGSTPPLVWTPVPLSASTTTQLWKIVFVSGSSFKLIKGTTLIGTYSTGVLVSQPEINFTIPTGSYSSGNSYEFYTYPYNANSIQLVEPSIPVADSIDITLNVTGGY